MRFRFFPRVRQANIGAYLSRASKLLILSWKPSDAFHLKIPRFKCEKAGSTNPVRRPIGRQSAASWQLAPCCGSRSDVFILFAAGEKLEFPPAVSYVKPGYFAPGVAKNP